MSRARAAAAHTSHEFECMHAWQYHIQLSDFYNDRVLVSPDRFRFQYDFHNLFSQ